MQETRVRSPGQEDPLEQEMATHSSIPARIIPWTEEAGGLQSMGSQKSWTRLSTPAPTIVKSSLKGRNSKLHIRISSLSVLHHENKPPEHSEIYVQKKLESYRKQRLLSKGVHKISHVLNYSAEAERSLSQTHLFILETLPKREEEPWDSP